MFLGMFKAHYKYWTVLLIVLGCIVFMVPGTAFAQPAPPHLFLGVEGAITRDSEPVKSGTITAWVDGENIASAAVVDGAYTLLVQVPDGSSFDGKKVTFTVDGDPTDANGIWRQGGADELSLKVIAAPASVPTLGPTASPVPTATLVPTATPVPAAVSAVPAQHNNRGFRENPTTRLRPVNDKITTDQDGIIEVFMVNPSVNDVPLSVDIVITVPSGVHVYGDGFACAGTGAGACAGSFTILPAQSKTATINIKGDKVGSYMVHFSGYWWPGENKDMRQPISLTHPFEVISPSKDLSEPEETLTPPTALPVSDKGGDGSCGLSSNSGVPLGAIGLFLGVGMMAFRNRLGKFF